MKIETLNKLFQAKNPQGRVYIAYPVKNGYETRSHTISVVYKVDGKVYEYRSTIVALAQRLDLIPNDDITTIAKRVYTALQTQDSVIDQAGASDTVRYMGINVDIASAGDDEYGRKLTEYRKITNDEWR